MAALSYADALDVLERAIARDTRNQILDTLLAKGDAVQAVTRLRVAMKTHTFPTGDRPLALERLVRTFDTRTRDEGFHVLESWDYRAHRFADDIVPVLMLDRGPAAPVQSGQEREALGILLDQYFLSVLGLLCARAWDEGDPNANLDRITTLLRSLGGTHRFVDTSETLLLLAISHYHPHEAAYDTLLDRVWSLDAEHATRVARSCASTLGGHLRWGHRFMYARDVGRMRADNVVDYPWLLFAVATLVRAYENSPAEAQPLLNGLSADPWCFTGKAPPSLERHAAIHGEARERLAAHRDRLRGDFEAHRPTAAAYTPLGLLVNFLCNAMVAMAATALQAGPGHPSLDDLFTSSDSRDYALLLARYAAAHGGRGDGAALIVYDPYEAQTAFNTTLRVLETAAT